MRLTISLDNPSLTYFAGQSIHGAVIVDTSHATVTSGLKIRCAGLERVRWTEHRGRAIVSRRDEIKYIWCKAYLIDCRGPEVPVPAGISRYPFIFQLPQALPSSFVGDHGRVEYYLQATFKRSWKLDSETRLNFSVNAIADLNTLILPPYGPIGPKQLSMDEALAFPCFRSRPIRCTLIVNQSGFVPGQQLGYSLEVSNFSNRNIESCTVTFWLGVTFYVRGSSQSSRSERVLVKRLDHSDIPKGEEMSWPVNGFKIPSLPPSSGLGLWSLINVEYWIEVKMKIFGHPTLKSRLPIVIGNIPLRNYFPPVLPVQRPPVPQATPVQTQSSSSVPPITPNSESQNPVSVVSQSQIETDSASGPLADYPELPPPTYEEAVGTCPTYGQVELAELETEESIYLQNRTFVPKYANYHFMD